MNPTKDITIKYFASFREAADRNEECLTTEAENAEQLYSELKKTYNFSLNTEQLKVAINNEFKDMNTPINEGDTVVFIPPVAGG